MTGAEANKLLAVARNAIATMYETTSDGPALRQFLAEVADTFNARAAEEWAAEALGGAMADRLRALLDENFRVIDLFGSASVDAEVDDATSRAVIAHFQAVQAALVDSKTKRGRSLADKMAAFFVALAKVAGDAAGAALKAPADALSGLLWPLAALAAAGVVGLLIWHFWAPGKAAA